MPPPARLRQPGIVKRILIDKGFGFLADTHGVEYFFHRSAAPDFNALAEGDAVTFVTAMSAKGPRAEQVQVVVQDSSSF